MNTMKRIGKPVHGVTKYAPPMTEDDVIIENLTETSHSYFKKYWDQAIDDHWRKVFKKALKQQGENDVIYIRVTGLMERAQVEARGFTFDSIATSLFNSRQNAFNMRIDRTLLAQYLKPKETK